MTGQGKRGEAQLLFSQGLVEGLRPISMWMDAGAAFSHQYPPPLPAFLFFCPSLSLPLTSEWMGKTGVPGRREREREKTEIAAIGKKKLAWNSNSPILESGYSSALLKKQEKHSSRVLRKHCGHKKVGFLLDLLPRGHRCTQSLGANDKWDNRKSPLSHLGGSCSLLFFFFLVNYWIHLTAEGLVLLWPTMSTSTDGPNAKNFASS